MLTNIFYDLFSKCTRYFSVSFLCEDLLEIKTKFQKKIIIVSSNTDKVVPIFYCVFYRQNVLVLYVSLTINIIRYTLIKFHRCST